ncbi:MAG TPA: hypothetical protein VHW96_17820 [Solirubrobacteraceae bacterium]|nr:hypothetical protein [Solirubrobacteraceae bacterium]
MAKARMSGRLPVGGAAAVAAFLLMILMAPAARAGDWMQVSCLNPNGTAAPFQGWTGSHSGGPEFGSNDDAACSPGSPMVANLSAVAQPAPGVANEFLTYTPPAGSTLVGGTMSLSMYGGGSGTNATAVAGLYEPTFNPSTDRFLVCARILDPCQNGGYTWSGTVALPADRGGNLIAAASCASNSGGTCSTNQDSSNNFADVFISQADLLLQNNAVPTGSGFTGTVLQPGARGQTDLTFTAADSGGPGVYLVQAFVDGTSVYSQTPNTNSGQCVPVGTDPGSGALMFDYQQPCPPAESVDVPISTTGLRDGSHELSVKVIDAAGNVATALDQTITASNPLVTPRQAKGVRAQFVMQWHWTTTRTTLRAIAVRKLPRGAHVRVSCAGRGCPKLRMRSATGGRIRRLLAGLHGRTFRAGDRLRLTVTAPRLRSENIVVTIRNNRIPQARLLR